MASLYFRIDFEGLTSLIRNLWAEGSYHRTRIILDDLVPSNIQELVIHGRLKLAQDPNGILGVDGIIIDDNWQVDLSACAYGVYPKFSELPQLEARLQQYRNRFFSMLRAELEILLSNLDRYSSGQRLEDVKRWVSSLPPEFVAMLAPSVLAKLTRYSGLQERLIDVDEYIKHQLELDKLPTPTPDYKYESTHGWFLPNGDFYPCGRTDHVWLADRLGKTERDAEAAGWIKVGSDLLGKAHIMPAGRHATQQQANSIFHWCKTHKVRCPRWLQDEEI